MSTTDLQALRRRGEGEIETYRYYTPANSVGVPWTRERVEAELAVMRTAIVEPYWADLQLRDTLEQISSEKTSMSKFAVVADDGDGTVLAFDPIEDEFLLAVKHEGQLVTIGVRGDAVGCFMSR